MKIDKELILNEIKNHLGIKKDAEFARFLGIKPQTLSSWYSRNTFDIELLYAKCEFLNAEWLLTGKGDMVKSYNQEPNILSLNSDFPKDCEELKNKYIKLLEEYNHLLKTKLNGGSSTDKSVS